MLRRLRLRQHAAYSKDFQRHAVQDMVASCVGADATPGHARQSEIPSTTTATSLT